MVTKNSISKMYPFIVSTTYNSSKQYSFFFLSFQWQNKKLDEINQLFLPNMRNKLLWFYQEVNEPEPTVVPEQPKPGPSRTAASNNSKTPQGTGTKRNSNWQIDCFKDRNQQQHEHEPLTITIFLTKEKVNINFNFNLRYYTSWTCFEAQIIPNRWMELCIHRRLYLHISYKYY